MANFARPIADISRGSWTTASGATANLWQQIDEETADDTDYVISAIGDNTSYECLLSSVAPAVIPRSHTIFLRGAKNAAAGNTKGVTITLVQGSTILGSTDFPNLPATVTQQSIDLPRSMAAAITNYADLRIRCTPTGITTGGGSRRRVVITGVALRVPSASDLVDDLLVRWGVTTGTQGGDVTASKSGFIGQGPTLSSAIWRLFDAMRQDETFYATNGAEIERRFAIAYGLWKVIEYERIRADIVAGTYALPPYQTQSDGIAICEAKISRFIASSQVNDAQDGG